MPLPYAIPLTGTGGLFTRIGALGGLLNAINLQRGTTIPTHVTSVNNQFLAANQDVISNLYSSLASYQSSAGSFTSAIRSMALQSITEMVNTDHVQLNNTPSTLLAYLIADMQANAQTVKKNVAGQSVSYGSGNTGNPVAVISTLDATGISLEYSFVESFIGTVSNDSFVSSNLAGIEPMTLIGQPSVSDSLSWLYPAGSGATVTISAVNPIAAQSGGVANWTTNGSMETFTTSNIPDGWHITTGTAGTNFLKTTSAGTFYDGVSALSLVGDSTTNLAIRSQFSLPSVTGDIRPVLGTYTQLAFNAFLKLSSTPAAGVLRVALSDGTNPINDAQGTANSFTVSLPSLGSGWVAVNGAFRSPKTLPTSAYLELKLTTPLSTGSSLYVDRVGLAQMTQLYRGGPFISLFSGNTNMIRGDNIFLSITNDLGGGFQSLFQRLFGMSSLSLQLPSASSPTISDSLIA